MHNSSLYDDSSCGFMHRFSVRLPHAGLRPRAEEGSTHPTTCVHVKMCKRKSAMNKRMHVPTRARLATNHLALPKISRCLDDLLQKRESDYVDSITFAMVQQHSPLAAASCRGENPVFIQRNAHTSYYSQTAMVHRHTPVHTDV